MEVARTSMICAAAPHFLWPFVDRSLATVVLLGVVLFGVPRLGVLSLRVRSLGVLSLCVRSLGVLSLRVLSLRVRSLGVLSLKALPLEALLLEVLELGALEVLALEVLGLLELLVLEVLVLEALELPGLVVLLELEVLVVLALLVPEVLVLKVLELPELVVLQALELETLELEALELETVEQEALELEALELEALELAALKLEALELEKLALEVLELEALELEALWLEAMELEALELEVLALEMLELEALELAALEMATLELEVLALGVLELVVLVQEALCSGDRFRSAVAVSQPQLQLDSPLPAPSPYTEDTASLTERREPKSRPASPVRDVRTGRRVSRQRPPPVPGTHTMALHPSSVPQRVPPASSLADGPDPESDLVRAASPTVTRLLASVVTNPSFESAATSALVGELVEFAAACCLDYTASLVAESESICPPSVGGECALGTDVLEDRQEDFECFAAAVPHLVAMLLAPERDPDARDIPTPRSYAEAITSLYFSQWQVTMDEEMAFWKSTGTYADAVPPRGANIVDGMWIFRVKRPPGSPPVFKARYVARGFSQQKELTSSRPSLLPRR
ncbi:unnamed protein product [Closterium sp. NIES-64]|nr:unnamed protein product [Closterium sp. NIES-64]